MEQKKYLEYYLDSKIYSKKDIEKEIEKTRSEFCKKQIRASVALNKFGVYIITFEIENKNNYFNKIKIQLIKKLKKQPLLRDANRTKRQYGQYKSTKTYKPY